MHNLLNLTNCLLENLRLKKPLGKFSLKLDLYLIRVTQKNHVQYGYVSGS